MEEQILELLNKKNKALSVHEICNELNYNKVEDLKKVMVILNYLEDNLKIRRTNKDNYETFKNKNVQIGTLMATKKSFAFVDIDGDDDVFIPPTCINGAVDGDKVVVEITSKKGVDLEGRIIRIVERNIHNLIGTVIEENGVKKLKLDNEKLKLEIIVKDENVMPGHKIIVKPTDKIGNNKYNCEVVRILGHINDPGVDILSIVCEHEFPDTFSEEVMNEVEKIPGHVSEEEINTRLANGGADLRNRMIFTIDGDDTKDIDDAVEVQKLENGNYYLGVHIADVSYYVKPGSKIYESAYTRGTSVYLADRVIPMLPHKLSNGICSLNPNEERLALSCMMEIDKKGKIISTDIRESIIKSRKQMTYKCVNSILEKDIIPEGYEEFIKELKDMAELSKVLRKMKLQRGEICFDVKEAKIIVDEECKPIEIGERERGTSEKMIEDFMIVANETVAEYITNFGYPMMYRIHEAPREKKLKEFLDLLKALGHKVKFKGKLKDIKPKQVQEILDGLKDSPDYEMLSELGLRAMQKAIYSTENAGHFALAAKLYCHFTSPIRRFPDDTVHRVLKMILHGEELTANDLNKLQKQLERQAEHSSLKERNSVECERDVEDMKMAEYMQDHIGETFEAKVASVVPSGMFVRLKNRIEGRVHVGSMEGDYYIVDEPSQSIIGKKSGIRYTIGDEVEVKAVDASKVEGTIDFELVKKKRLKYEKKS